MIKVVLRDAQYYPGSTVEGVVVVNARKPEDYKDVTIEIHGFASVKWTEPQGHHHITYTNNVRYIEKKILLWSREQSTSGNLSIGEHSFPFSVQLPDEAPPSFRSKPGEVSYKLKARLAKTKLLKRDERSEIILDVKSYIPSFSLHPQNIELNCSLTFCCCFNFGQVKVNCRLPRWGYTLGEDIPLTMQVDNLSNRNVYIKASIITKKVYTSRGQTKTVSKKNLAILHFQVIPMNTTTLLQGNFQNIPTTLPVSIINCSVLSVKYWVAIQASSSLSSSEKEMIPIIIANAPPPPTLDTESQ